MQVSGLPSALGEGGGDIKQIKESKEGGDTQKRISRPRKKKTNSLPVEKERVIRNDILNGEKNVTKMARSGSFMDRAAACSGVYHHL